MASLSNRPNTALVIVDVQNDVVAKAFDRDNVIANINTLICKARTENVPVMWVQHGDDDLPANTPGWEYVPELQREASEPLIHKSYGDSFEATSFEDELAQLAVGRLVVTGAQTDFCIRSTLHGAMARGYDTVLVSDAHTTDDMSEHGMPAADKLIKHTNYYWRNQDAPDRTAQTVKTSDVTFTVT
jgi:nicotinamidase-related amidase